VLYTLRFEVFSDSRGDVTTYQFLGLLALAALWIALLSAYGTYSREFINSGTFAYARVIQASLMYFLITSSALYLLHSQTSRILVVGSIATCLGFTLILRIALQKLLVRGFRQGLNIRNVMLIGDTEFQNRIYREINAHPNLGLQTSARFNYPELDTPDSWSDVIFAKAVASHIQVLVVQELADIPPRQFGHLSWLCQQADIELLTAPVYMESLGPRFQVRPHLELSLLRIDEPHLTWVTAFFKRVIDIMLSAIGIILLSPFLVLIALAIRVGSKGPIFYVEQRVGRFERLFTFPKFRTMYQGSNTLRSQVIGVPDENITTRYRNDPRLTPFGRFLRRFSLDETPQFFCVLIGRMSIVGPRQILQEERLLIAQGEERRHLLKPGLTGLWQINGRKDTTWEERIQYDLFYINNWSIGLDFSILLKTVKAVVTGRGAY